MKHKSRVLAVASGGGHWIQLLRLRPAFADYQVTYISVDPSGRHEVAPAAFHVIPDANRSRKCRLVVLTFRLLWLFIRVRPHCVITTGAAPGYLAVRIGRMLGVRSLFIDSIANAEKLSLSAHLSLRHADLTLTQWSHLSADGKASFRGSLL